MKLKEISFSECVCLRAKDSTLNNELTKELFEQKKSNKRVLCYEFKEKSFVLYFKTSSQIWSNIGQNLFCVSNQYDNKPDSKIYYKLI